jgi:hypothetical protein
VLLLCSVAEASALAAAVVLGSPPVALALLLAQPVPAAEALPAPAALLPLAQWLEVRLGAAGVSVALVLPSALLEPGTLPLALPLALPPTALGLSEYPPLPEALLDCRLLLEALPLPPALCSALEEGVSLPLAGGAEAVSQGVGEGEGPALLAEPRALVEAEVLGAVALAPVVALVQGEGAPLVVTPVLLLPVGLLLALPPPPPPLLLLAVPLAAPLLLPLLQPLPPTLVLLTAALPEALLVPPPELLLQALFCGLAEALALGLGL